MSVCAFQGKNSIGVLIRAYSPLRKDVAKNVKRLRGAVDRLFQLSIAGTSMIQLVDILVWADLRYQIFDGSSKSDCGKLAGALATEFLGQEEVGVHEITRGDIYSTVLNDGLGIQAEQEIGYTLILSPELIHVLNLETLSTMMKAAERGAQVIPVATEDVRDLVLRGFPCNSLCMWDRRALMRVGGFDIRDAKPILAEDDPTRLFLEPHTSYVQTGGKRMHDAGVGEVLAMIKMFLLNAGAPITAPILPLGVGDTRYKQADDPKRAAWVAQKFSSKMDRLLNMLARSGYNLEHMYKSVMPEYQSGAFVPIR